MENNKAANTNFDGERERSTSFDRKGRAVRMSTPADEGALAAHDDEVAALRARSNDVACGQTIELLTEVCNQLMQRTNDAALAVGVAGPQNQAIGALMGVETMLEDALALYRVALNLHRRGA